MRRRRQRRVNVARLDGELTRFVGPQRVGKHRVKILGLTVSGPVLFALWLIPGAPPPGPFG